MPHSRQGLIWTFLLALVLNAFHSTAQRQPEKVSSLGVRIQTSTRFRAGTDNDVYFDVGPLAWKLDKENHDDFERGANDTYVLPIDPGLSLTADDLVWVRLQKKGLLGFTGGGDGIDGQWKPDRVTLIVNGRDFFSSEVGIWLSSDRPFWKVDLRRFDAPEMLARTLRVVANDPLARVDEELAMLTTPFKIQGISGWLLTEVGRVCATGVVLKTPGVSTDGFATIDLRVQSLEVQNRQFTLDGTGGIGHQRYLRIEYQHRGNRISPSGNPQHSAAH